MPSVLPASEAQLQEEAPVGFREGARTMSYLAGIHYGFEAFGGQEAHDIAITSLTYGRIMTPVLASDRFWRGNLEVRGELFGGVQFSPDSDWVVGLTPHLRYNFVSCTCVIPFLDAGAGLTATGIGPPDLSGTFEFNLQFGTGVHWFFVDDLALTAEALFMHLSCAGISVPNLGVNGVVVGLLGVTWTF